MKNTRVTVLYITADLITKLGMKPTTKHRRYMDYREKNRNL